MFTFRITSAIEIRFVSMKQFVLLCPAIRFIMSRLIKRVSFKHDSAETTILVIFKRIRKGFRYYIYQNDKNCDFRPGY